MKKSGKIETKGKIDMIEGIKLKRGKTKTKE